MVAEYGMSDAIGPVAFNTRTRASFLGLPDAENVEHVAEETAREIDQEVRRIMIEAYERALATIRQHRAALDAVVRLLLDREIVEGSEVRRIVLSLPAHTAPRAAEKDAELSLPVADFSLSER